MTVELKDVLADGSIPEIKTGGAADTNTVMNKGQTNLHLDDGSVPSFQKDTTDPKPKVLNESEIEEKIAFLSDAVHWRGQWVAGQYSTYDCVRDGQWLMIANKVTSDRAAPQPQGDPLLDLAVDPTFPVTPPAHLGVVWSGHKYTFSQSGWITKVEVKVPTLTSDTNYRFRFANLTDPDNPIVDEMEEPVLGEDAWTAIFVGQRMTNANEVLAIICDALNSGSDTVYTGGWTLTGIANTIPTPATPAGWSASHRDNVLRIDKTDLDSVDRTSELSGIGPQSTIQFAETATPANYNTYYITSAARDGGTYFEWDMIIDDQGGTLANGATTTMTATVPIHQSTDYNEEADYFVTNGQPSFCTMEGYLEFDGVPQTGKENNAYGIRITFQPAYVSPDWEVMADIAGVTLGGSGGAASQVQASSAFEKQIYDSTAVLGVSLTVAEIEGVIPAPLPPDTGFMIRDPNNLFIVYWDGINYYYERLTRAN